MIEVSGAKTVCRCDNLSVTMRELYYRLIAEGLRPTYIRASPVVMADYEAILIASPDPTTITAPPKTFFKDVPMECDGDMPQDELHFLSRGQVVGKLTHIS